MCQLEVWIRLKGKGEAELAATIAVLSCSQSVLQPTTDVPACTICSQSEGHLFKDCAKDDRAERRQDKKTTSYQPACLTRCPTPPWVELPAIFPCLHLRI